MRQNYYAGVLKVIQSFLLCDKIISYCATEVYCSYIYVWYNNIDKPINWVNTLKIIMPRGAHFTPEFSRKVGLLGGRPKGVLSPHTIAKIKSKETFAEEVAKKAGLIADSLLQNLVHNKDTSAGKELLERAFGKVPQALNVQTVQFSLKELAEYRKNLQNPPVESIELPPDKKDDV